MKEPYFIEDPNMKERNDFLKEFNAAVDPQGYKRKVFLKYFVLSLISAFAKKKGIRRKHKIKMKHPLKPAEQVKKIKFNFPSIRPSPLIKPSHPVKKLPYPKPLPIFQLKPVVRRRLNKKKLPYLKPKNKKVFMQSGKLFYDTDVFKDYFKQVSSLLADPGIKTIYCDGLNKPLLVDYFNDSYIETKIVFDDKKKLNDLLKKFAKENGFRFKKDKPMVLKRLKEGVFFQGNLGNDLIDPRFIIKKGKGL